ncbi:hypothetical protein LF95_01885 [Thalassospira sp. TSL5-1]|nr:hypothetical protein LF95_01885 [Thalassospira sp. TSL5-1]
MSFLAEWQAIPATNARQPGSNYRCQALVTYAFAPMIARPQPRKAPYRPLGARDQARLCHIRQHIRAAQQNETKALF